MWIMSFGIMCFINAVFDSIILYLKASRSSVPFFGKSLPWQLNLVHAFLISGCILQAMAAVICNTIQKDHTAHYEENERLVEPYQANSSAQYGSGNQQSGRGSQPQHQAFHGQGQRLGSA